MIEGGRGEGALQNQRETAGSPSHSAPLAPGAPPPSTPLHHVGPRRRPLGRRPQARVPARHRRRRRAAQARDQHHRAAQGQAGREPAKEAGRVWGHGSAWGGVDGGGRRLDARGRGEGARGGLPPCAGAGASTAACDGRPRPAAPPPRPTPARAVDRAPIPHPAAPHSSSSCLSWCRACGPKTRRPSWRRRPSSASCCRLVRQEGGRRAASAVRARARACRGRHALHLPAWAAAGRQGAREARARAPTAARARPSTTAHTLSLLHLFRRTQPAHRGGHRPGRRPPLRLLPAARRRARAPV